MLVVHRDLGAVGQPGEADDHDEAVGQAHERLDRHALGLHRPLLVELAGQRMGRALADVDRTAGTERPAARPGGQPRRAAAGEPAPVGGAGHGERRHRLRGVAVDEPQRPARRLQLEHEVLAALGVRHEAARQPVVTRGATLAQRGDRRVGGVDHRLRRVVLLVAPARVDAVGRPVAAGEDGRLLHALNDSSAGMWGTKALDAALARAPSA